MGGSPGGNPGADLTTDQLAKWRRLVRLVNHRYENYAHAEPIPYVDSYNVHVDPASGSCCAAFAHTNGTDGATRAPVALLESRRPSGTPSPRSPRT